MTDRVQEIRPIKRAVEDELLNRPGVTAVDIGYKYVGGERTGEIVIRVHVAHKGDDVPEDQKIPPMIDGVPTDVLEGRYEPLTDSWNYNTLRGGISVGPFRGVDGLWSGTLGAMVIDRTTGDAMVLSNYHVLCINEGWHDAIKEINQPAWIDNPFTYGPIARLRRGVLDGNVDAAVARCLTDSDRTGYVCEVQEIGVLTGTAEATTPEGAWGLKVRKRGKTTGLSYGTVDGIEGSVPMTYPHGVGDRTLYNQICIWPDWERSPNGFAEGGDSGSVIVDDHDRVIGLLFAGYLGGRTYANPILNVLNELDVNLALAGIGGFDLTTQADRVFALAYVDNGKPIRGTGTLDHLALYRPGKGAFYLVAPDGEGPDKNVRFTPLYKQPQGGSGIGTFDLADSRDRIIAFDGTSSGKPDHMLCYRPGKKIAQVLKHDGADKDGTPTFSTVYKHTDGIAGFDLASDADRVLAYDLESTGKLDHLVIYRPSQGAVSVIQRDSGAGANPMVFSALYKQPQGGSGIGTYDLTSDRDRIIAFDAAGTGKLDHLLCYRPGKGIAFFLRPDGVGTSGLTFTPIYKGTSGIGEFDLSVTTDQVIAYDFDGSGKLDHLVLYRPGTSSTRKGVLFIIKCTKSNGSLVFTTVYRTDQKPDIGGFELTSLYDQVIAYDFDGSSKLDHLLLYRPGNGIVSLVKHNGTKPDGTPAFKLVYRANGVS